MWDNLTNISIEKTLLKSIYSQPEILGDVTDILGTTNAHFYDDNNRATYKVLLQLYEAGKEINEYNVINKLAVEIGKTQATTHLVKLMSSFGTNQPIETAYQVVEQSVKRRIYLLGDRLRKQAVSTSSHLDILNEIDQELKNINQESTANSSKAVGKIVEQFYKSIQSKVNPLELTTFETGYKEFDKMLKGGFVGGQLIIIAGRPSMGKSMLTTNLALRMAQQDMPVVIFSLEMTQNELLMRIVNQYAEKDVIGDRDNLLDNEQFVNTMLDIHSLPLFIDDAGRLDLITLKTKARRLIKQHGIKAIFIDYLQLMTGPQHQSREREVAELSKGLKMLAKELEIPIICLAQLNRSVETRQSKIPALSDLRESGSIEQDADVVIFIHRKKYYDERADDQADIIFAKNRSAGLTGTVKLLFDNKSGAFR